MTPGGQVVDFSALEWGATPNKWCDVNGLDGDTFAYAGTPSTSTVAVDTTARNLRLNFTVTAGQYAGGGVSFDSCVDASFFNAISFTASVTAGSLTGCVWQVQLQTQDQRPSNLIDPTGGTCNPDAGTGGCYRYPAATLAMPVAATYVVPFTSFNNPSSSTIPAAMQIVGVQWQANSQSGTGTCTVELRVDNVRFVTQ